MMYSDLYLFKFLRFKDFKFTHVFNKDVQLYMYTKRMFIGVYTRINPSNAIYLL